MKFEKFIDVIYLIGTIFILIGLIQMHTQVKENQLAIQQLVQEREQIGTELDKLQQRLFELRIEVEKTRLKYKGE